MFPLHLSNLVVLTSNYQERLMVDLELPRITI